MGTSRDIPVAIERTIEPHRIGHGIGIVLTRATLVPTELTFLAGSANGDIWGAGGNVYVFSGGAARNCSAIP